MMKKKILWAIVGAGLAVALGQGCAARPAVDQIKFGIWASQQNLWDEAIFRWKKAAAADPGSVAAHNNLAVAYERKGLVDEAIKEYELALKINPKNSSVKSNYQNCKENSQPAKDAAEAKKADVKK